MPAVNYVKFMRGTQAMYNALAEKNSDTLYFVYENASADRGKLYLGNKLISGSSGIDGEISISDIADVVIGENLSDGDVLVYNQATGKWEATPLTDAIGMDVFIGATQAENGIAGLVPAPVVADRFKYLRGDGTWAEVEATLSQQDAAAISGLQAQVTTLVGSDTGKSAATIAVEQISNLLIPQDAQESLDTLQEIGAWIQSHPDDAASINSSIVQLQSDVSNLDEILNGTELEPDSGLVSRVDALEDTMGTFVAVPDNYLDVGSAISYLNNSITNLDNSVTAMNDRLRWHELAEEE